MYEKEEGSIKYFVLVRPERKRPLGRHTHNGRIILKCNFKAFEEWSRLIWLRTGMANRLLLSAVLNIWVPAKAENFLTS